MVVDFGRTASDYARYRGGFPDRFYDQLFNNHWIAAGDRVLDLGAGTGTIARALAKRGCNVIGLDSSDAIVKQARLIDAEEGIETEYVTATAEKTGLQSHFFNAVTAGTSWHWFDRSQAAAEVRRVLKPGGRLIIASLAWLPISGGVVEATEALIRAHNADWDEAAAQDSFPDKEGIQPLWFEDLAEAQFTDIESFSFDVVMPYTHEAWLGRIRASAGVAASLPADRVKRFDDAHRAMLGRDFPADPLRIPHRVFAVSGRTSPQSER